MLAQSHGWLSLKRALRRENEAVGPQGGAPALCLLARAVGNSGGGWLLLQHHMPCGFSAFLLETNGSPALQRVPPKYLEKP